MRIRFKDFFYTLRHQIFIHVMLFSICGVLQFYIRIPSRDKFVLLLATCRGRRQHRLDKGSLRAELSIHVVGACVQRFLSPTRIVFCEPACDTQKREELTHPYFFCALRDGHFVCRLNIHLSFSPFSSVTLYRRDEVQLSRWWSFVLVGLNHNRVSQRPYAANTNDFGADQSSIGNNNRSPSSFTANKSKVNPIRLYVQRSNIVLTMYKL